MDGVFDSLDVDVLSRSSRYDDGIDLNWSWRDGDFNGDGDFDSRDWQLAY